MSIHTKVAKKLLTKAEQNHLTKDAGINSMAALKRQVEFMKDEKDFPCWTCKSIARKLGIDVNA